MADNLTCDSNSEVKSISTENFREIVDLYRQSSTLCDVTLVANDDVKFSVHRVILASVSPVFRAMFKENTFKEGIEKTATIQNIDADTLGCIIKFIYTFELKVDQKNVMSLLTAADYLAMNSIIKLCCKFIEQNRSVKNCIPFMLGAKAIFNTEIMELCFSYLEQNASDILESATESLYDLWPDDLTALISSEHLGIPKEMEVFKLIINWVKHDEENRYEFLPSLLTNVQFIRMPKEDLEVVLKEPLLHHYNCYESLSSAKFYNMYESLPTKTKSKFREMLARASRRLPRDLGEPNVIFAIPRKLRNIGQKLSLDYLDISSVADSSDLLWKTMPSVFSFNRRSSKLVVSPRGLMFEIGGTNRQSVPQDKVDLLDLTKIRYSWTSRKSMHLARLFFAVCMGEDKIFVVGGFAQYKTGGLVGGTTKTCEVYDIATNTWLLTTPMRLARKNCSAVYDNGVVYVVGGVDFECAIVECYHVASNTWTELSVMPALKSHTSLMVMNSMLYVIGGVAVNSTSGMCNTVECCNLITEEWSSLAPMNKRRALTNVVVIKNKLYVIGGDNNNAYSYTAEIYDPVINEWDIISAPRNMLDEYYNEPYIIPFSKTFLKFGNIDLI